MREKGRRREKGSTRELNSPDDAAMYLDWGDFLPRLKLARQPLEARVLLTLFDRLSIYPASGKSEGGREREMFFFN